MGAHHGHGLARTLHAPHRADHPPAPARPDGPPGGRRRAGTADLLQALTDFAWTTLPAPPHAGVPPYAANASAVKGRTVSDRFGPVPPNAPGPSGQWGTPAAFAARAVTGGGSESPSRWARLEAGQWDLQNRVDVGIEAGADADQGSQPDMPNPPGRGYCPRRASSAARP